MSPYKLELEDDRCRSSAKVLPILVHYKGKEIIITVV